MKLYEVSGQVYVLAFVDKINVSYGNTSLDEGTEIVAVSSSVDRLKKFAEEQGPVNWQQNDMNQVIGITSYDGEEEEDQFYMIVAVHSV